VLRAIRAQLPHERLLYCADSLHAPYGERSNDYVTRHTLAACDWLVSQGVKAIVVACNTATAQTIHVMRERYALPIVGIEPGIKPASLLSRNRVAGVLATASTLQSAKFERLMALHAGDCRFICQAGNGLVEAIEAGDTGSPKVLSLLDRYLAPMLAAGADTLVLGCTHYPFFDLAIRAVGGAALTQIEPGAAVARQLERLLGTAGLLAAGPLAMPGSTPGSGTSSTNTASGKTPKAASSMASNPAPGSLRLCSTSDGAHLRALAAALLQLELAVETIRFPVPGEQATTAAAPRDSIPEQARAADVAP
jgi:glutamate racemase